MSRADRLLALFCLLAFLACAFCFVDMQIGFGWMFAYFDRIPVMSDRLPQFALAIGAGATIWLARANDQAEVSGRDVIPCVVGLVIAMVGAGSYTEPAPLIALGVITMLIVWRGWWVWRRRS